MALTTYYSSASMCWQQGKGTGLQRPQRASVSGWWAGLSGSSPPGSSCCTLPLEVLSEDGLKSQSNFSYIPLASFKIVKSEPSINLPFLNCESICCQPSCSTACQSRWSKQSSFKLVRGELSSKELCSDKNVKTGKWQLMDIGNFHDKTSFRL